MLPLLAVGAGLKVLWDINEANEWNEVAKEKINKGERNKEEAEKYVNEIKNLLKITSQELDFAKKEGLKCLLNNYSYLKNRNLTIKNTNLKRYEKLIEEDINKYRLKIISVKDVMNIGKNIENIAKKFNLNLNNINYNKSYNNNIEDFIFESGMSGVTIGTGILLFSEMSLLSATGIGIMIAAPIISWKKKEEAEENYYKAKQFLEKTRVEKEKWKGQVDYIKYFTELILFYKNILYEVININNLYLKKLNYHKNERNIIKNFIALAYLDKILLYYPSINKENMTDYNKLLSWIAYEYKTEKHKFEDIQKEIKKIKGQ